MQNNPNQPEQSDQPFTPNQYNQPNQPFTPNQYNQPPQPGYPSQQPGFPPQGYQQQPYPNPYGAPTTQNAMPTGNPGANPFGKTLGWYKRQRNLTKVGVGCGSLFALLVLCSLCSVTVQGASSQQTAAVATPTIEATPTAGPAATPTPTPKPKPTPKPTPTPKPAPTKSPAQIEAEAKKTFTDTTVPEIDKLGNQDKDKLLHFTCTLVKFVKDDQGNTAGANVSDPNNPGTFVQIAFPDGTDLSKLNEGDTIEVWGIGGEVASGQNAFGGTVQESTVGVAYITDTTTGYQK